uniref:Uncharacterized protein n=1 Tax=Haptolina ericina TaxID=156174 RepID=A0A7S3AWP1_9EUKA
MNRLSGFVPFLQISKNEHKSEIEKSPKDARTRVYYRHVMAREQALSALTKVLREAGHSLQIEDPKINLIRKYEPKAFGLDVPEPLLVETYIKRADITPVIGWETGRPSVPQFMDMNLHAIRDNSRPRVVLYQFDLSDCMNPSGLLVAYAEAEVKPVCSDFDTFTVGSKGMVYETTPPEQVEIVQRTLAATSDLLANPTSKGWTGRWLDKLKDWHDEGFHVSLPTYGFGDPISYNLIGDVVYTTRACGAVRHGAECFNFYFPQELDDEFLIIWQGFTDPPWQLVKPDRLRQFLIERAKEGYCFPMNPVWPIRDPGWYEVYQALKQSPDGAANLKYWFPPESGLMEKIESMHSQYPNGFVQKPEEKAAGGEPADGGKEDGRSGGPRSMSMMLNLVNGFGTSVKPKGSTTPKATAPPSIPETVAEPAAAPQ